jgi:hypothetical protein
VAAPVKVCGWRPHDGGAACTGGRHPQTFTKSDLDGMTRCWRSGHTHAESSRLESRMPASSTRPRVDAGGLQPGIQADRLPTRVGLCGNRGVSTRTRSLAREPIDECDRRWSATYYLQLRQIVSLRFSFSSSA